ncbi:uncharacterized protein BXZ73DRAFT_11249, partial [Epithele typhae]|uniref:uncharacterized protein n=1 Tax=Epithele typhae TaxID=378194 RepID=UPI002008959D
YSDYHSVATNTFGDSADPRYSAEEILKLVAHQELRSLCWTSYDDNVPFQHIMTPLLVQNIMASLEYLKLFSPSSSLHHLNTAPSSSISGLGFSMNIHLPSLCALKVSLDNDALAGLAAWNMPNLTTLSVLSLDFSHTREGFSAFLRSHGCSLTQLELSHTSSIVDNYYLTTPRHRLQSLQDQQQPVPIAKWCPNLCVFICAADAEWYWRYPDWIPPHTLLASHPKIQFVGIRDFSTQLTCGRLSPLLYSTNTSIFGEDEPADTTYQLLCEQIRLLLHPGSFPNLRLIRDLSFVNHHVFAAKPSHHVSQLWAKVRNECERSGVSFEVGRGISIT